MTEMPGIDRWEVVDYQRRQINEGLIGRLYCFLNSKRKNGWNYFIILGLTDYDPLRKPVHIVVDIKSQVGKYKERIEAAGKLQPTVNLKTGSSNRDAERFAQIEVLTYLGGRISSRVITTSKKDGLIVLSE